jgi:hypothetical protein
VTRRSLVEGLTSGGAKSKTKGAIEDAEEKRRGKSQSLSLGLAGDTVAVAIKPILVYG